MLAYGDLFQNYPKPPILLGTTEEIAEAKDAYANQLSEWVKGVFAALTHGKGMKYSHVRGQLNQIEAGSLRRNYAAITDGVVGLAKMYLQFKHPRDARPIESAIRMTPFDPENPLSYGVGLVRSLLLMPPSSWAKTDDDERSTFIRE